MTPDHGPTTRIAARVPYETVVAEGSLLAASQYIPLMTEQQTTGTAARSPPDGPSNKSPETGRCKSGSAPTTGTVPNGARLPA